MAYEKFSIEGKVYGDKGQLTVLPWDGEIYKPPSPSSRGGEKIYKLHCTECAKDPEMFGEAIFRGRKRYLELGKIPCGCAEDYRPTFEQHKLKMERICSTKNYTLIQYHQDNTNPHSSKKADIYCNSCDKSFSTKPTRLYSGYGCPFCAHKKIGWGNSKPDKDLVGSFMATGNYIEGTTFTRTDRKIHNTYVWEVFCPICSVDDYVENGVCSGKFEAVVSTLQQGALPCRCATNHIPTQEQREYELGKILKNEPQYKFVRWDTAYKNTKSDMWINCVHHGDWKVRLNNFVSDNATRCPICSGNGGYSRKEDGYIYVLSVEGGNKRFTGYGISNTPKKRLADHIRNLKAFGFAIESKEIFKMTGDQAADIEKLIKQEFPVDPQTVEGFKRESTYNYLYQDVINFVKEQLDPSQNSAYNEEQTKEN